MNVENFIKNNFLKIIVKPNAPVTKILGYDEDRKALKVAVAARAQDGKANLEVLKFFSRLLKAKVEIKLGLSSREKLLKIIL